jgi:small subunit ribosomal protein S11
MIILFIFFFFFFKQKTGFRIPPKYLGLDLWSFRLGPVTDKPGKFLSWCSSGTLAGFRGAKKSTPFAAQLVAENAAKKAIDAYGLKEVEVYLKGPGMGRESAVRSLDNVGLYVSMIKDVTPVPHNGCRPKKRRRV